jgi:hypothetical protein
MSRAWCCALALLVPGASRVAAQSDAPAPSAVEWAPAPGVVPRGARMAVLSGDPFKPAVLRVLIAMPDGYRLPPHFHPRDEHVEVKQGTFLVGMGDQLDLK